MLFNRSKETKKEIIQGYNLNKIKKIEHLKIIEGEMFVPFINKSVNIDIDENVDIEYANRCIESIKRLPQDVIKCIIDKIFHYYEICKNNCEENGVEIKYITLDDVLQNISISNISISEPKGNDIAYSMSGECIWEEEHGIEIIIKGNKVVYVGDCTGHDPWEI